METKQQISFIDFVEIEKQLSIKIGMVTDAELVPKSYGLKLTVDFGDGDVRTVFTNLGKTHTALDFVGGLFPFITNLEPTLIKGVESHAMILVGEKPSGEVALSLSVYSAGTKLL
jgi:tRNA-binding EMAP/Myf-like protein